MRGTALSLLLCLVSLTAACAGKEGAAGPMGPPGPQGPQGPAGPGTTKLVVTAAATYSSSSASYGASATLPSAVGIDPARPPALDCYMTDNPSSGVWLTVGGGTTGAYDTSCGAVFSGGVWHAAMIQMPGAGWTAAFVVTY
jgi:hypothetical protein